MSYDILNVYIYTRVSTDEQAKNGESLDDQELRCIEAIKKHNESINDDENAEEWELVHVFREEGKSGASTKNRTELDAMLNIIEEYDIVMFTKIDRLARNNHDYHIILGQIYEKNARVYILDQGGFVDEADIYGQINLSLLVIFAEFERDMIQKRVAEGMEYRRCNNHVTTASLPFGYRMTEDKKVEIDPERAEFVKWVFKRYDETKIINQVVREANQNPDFVKLKSGRKGITIKRPEYGSHNIKDILKNKAYTGVYEYKSKKTKEKEKNIKKKSKSKGRIDEFRPGKPEHTSYEFFEKIIEPELFESVQESLEKNKGARKTKNHIYLFQSLVWDYSNDKPSRMGGSYAERKKFKNGRVVGRSKLYLYKTTYRYTDGREESPKDKWLAISEEKLLKIAIEETKKHIDLSQYSAKKKTKKDSKNNQKKIDSLNKELKKKEKDFNDNMTRWHDEIKRNYYFKDPMDFEKKQSTLQEEITDIKKELLRLEPQKNKKELERMKETANTINPILEVIEKSIEEDPEKVRKFWQETIKRIEVRKIPGKNQNSKGGNKDVKIIFRF